MNESWVNPLTGMNGRGFYAGRVNHKVEKQACREILQKALPAGHELVSFRYKPSGHPSDTVVEIRVRVSEDTVDTITTRAPVDTHNRTWGGRIPTVLAAFLKKHYE